MAVILTAGSVLYVSFADEKTIEGFGLSSASSQSTGRVQTSSDALISLCRKDSPEGDRVYEAATALRSAIATRYTRHVDAKLVVSGVLALFAFA